VTKELAVLIAFVSGSVAVMVGAALLGQWRRKP
jgi:hypothetical protein